MTDQIEQLFRQARETEIAMPEHQFVPDLQARLRFSPQQASIKNYDWISIVAVVLATLLVFWLTPVSFWLNAIPYLNLSFDSLILMSFSALALIASCFWFFEWDGL